MFQVLTWWLLIELIGLAVWPVAFRFFRNLPDRGYAFIKPLGLLLIAYPFWFFTTLGFLTNTRGVVVGVTAVVAGLSWWFGGRTETTAESDHVSRAIEPALGVSQGHSPLAWLRGHVSLVLAVELVFTLAFFAWSIFRAYTPEITATEKPMEFAFLNGILQSDHFPPRDPWLSGYAISYYYFGYVIVAMLTLLSGVASSVAFNLAIALLFALSATGAYGLAYDLIRNSKSPAPVSNLQSFLFPIFAPVFLVLAGNLEGFFEALHARGWGSPNFWNWLDVKGLIQAPVTSTFVPNDNWWWWRASRVVHDVAQGQTQEVIDEFPQFSFLLGDLHPHVLALPFVLLALAAALNLLCEPNPSPSRRGGLGEPSGQAPSTSDDALGDLRSRLSQFAIRYWLFPLILGGLFFLNTWDILPYAFILFVSFGIARYCAGRGWNSDATRDLVIFVIGLGALSILLYLPFYLGFQTQAGGILPVLFVKTRLHQYLIMFGLFAFVLGGFLLRLFLEYRATEARDLLIRAAQFFVFFVGFVAFPIIVAVLIAAVLILIPAVRESVMAYLPGSTGNALLNVLAAYFDPLLSDPWLYLSLAISLAMILTLLRMQLPDESITFVLLLAFTGFLLTFGVEFVYLRDTFGTRMNTVFKFYFQTWTLFSIAAAYAVYYLSRALNVAHHHEASLNPDSIKSDRVTRRQIARGIWFIALLLLLGASLMYPAMAIPNRADGFKKSPTLDGIQWIRDFSPGDYAAIQWLNTNAPRGSVIVEAVGGQYSYGNRISMATGLATPLGWFGHELQWRGNTKLFKDDAAGIDRGADIARIYQSLNPNETLTLLDKYDIKFVVLGQTERTQYGLTKAQIDKFGHVLNLVFENGDLRIYARGS